MPTAEREEGDPDLQDLFERFGARLVSPGGAAALLGLSRTTIYTLGKRGRVRVFHSREKDKWSETGAIDAVARGIETAIHREPSAV
jgi:hypothetical protein